MPDADDLAALGLDRAQAALLAYVLAHEEVSAAELSAATGLAQPRVSTVVTSLVRLGLLDRVKNRRPSVVFVSHFASEAADALGFRAAQQRRDLHDRENRARAAITAAAAAATQRGRPLYEIEPRVAGYATNDVDTTRVVRLSHDEVRSAAGLDPFWTTRPSCRTRLLLMGGVSNDLGSLRKRASMGGRLAELEVRTTTDDLPRLVVLDGNRVGVDGGTTTGRVRAWSRERSHVSAAAELFELWWARAEPGVLIPATPRPSEPDYDIDEWDPDELPDQPAP